ncbi:MAG: hypothetical protein ACI86H_001867 [bacterium]|jgi:hypothetical protein
MGNSQCTVGIGSQIEIFYPLIIKETNHLAKIITKVTKLDMMHCPWFFIFDERTNGDFSNPHVLERGWDDFVEYFLQKKHVYVFLQEPVVGIVSKKPKFWMFFDPKIAAKYFQRQTEKPKNFSADRIQKIGFIPIAGGLQTFAKEALQDKSLRVMQQIKKIEAVLAMVDFYLPEEENQSIEKELRKIIITLSLAEVRLLESDISDAGVSPTMLEKRLEAIYRMCIRLYAVRKNNKDKDALKALLSPKITIRKKALQLIEKKLVADLES